MFESSYVSKSRQMWKLYLGFALIFLGGASLIFGLSRLANGGIIAVLSAIALDVLAAVWLIFAVRCPGCGTKLFLRAVAQERHDQWLFSLLAATQCPQCHADAAEHR